MTENTVKNCVNDLKKLRGIEPYNYPSNLCYADGYFAKVIEKKYSERVKKLAEKELRMKNDR